MVVTVELQHIYCHLRLPLRLALAVSLTRTHRHRDGATQPQAASFRTGSGSARREPS